MNALFFNVTIHCLPTEEYPLHPEAAGHTQPDAFGPFRVLHQIGAGALGPVFRAYEPELDKLVAVKHFRLELSPERVHRLVELFEVLAAADLTHPSIAAPIAAGLHDLSAYLAQDFVAADSIDVVLRNHGPAPPRDVLRVTAELAGALDFAAAVNVLHGALHPRDVLVSSDDARLTGLGVARAVEHAGGVAPVRRPYTAPERAAGGSWDRRSDVFSLAALTHEMLWGRRIVGPGKPVIGALPRLAGAEPAALGAVFARGLAERPDDRFATALEFAEALRQVFTDVPAAVVETRTARRPARKRPVKPAEEGERSVTDYAAVDRATAAMPRLPLDVEAPGAPTAAVEGSPELREPDDPAPDFVSEQFLDHPPAAAVAVPPTVGSLSTPRPVLPPVLEQSSVAAPAHASMPDLTLTNDPPPVIDYEEPLSIASERASFAKPEIDNPTAPPIGHRPAATIPEVSAPVNLERQRSSLRPILLAGVIGVAVGFASGYGVALRDHSDLQSESDVTSQATVATTGPLGPPEAATAPVAPAAAEAAKPKAALPPATPVPLSARPSAPPAARATAPSPGQEPVRAETPSGRVLVRSTPADALVTLNGREMGRTPVALRELPVGTHTVRVARDGYQPEERRVSISTTRPTTSITFELERVAGAATAATPRDVEQFTGWLIIESRPTGASVFLDGRAIGTTPLSVGEVSAGEHAVRLEREGYRRWTASVRVVSGQRNRVNASLEQ